MFSFYTFAGALWAKQFLHSELDNISSSKLRQQLIKVFLLQVLLAGRCPSLAFWHQHSFYLSASHLNSTMRATLRFYTFLYFSQFTSPEELPLEQQQTCLRPPELFPLRDKTTVWLCQQFPMSLSPLSMILWKVNIKMEEWHEVSLNNWWIH